ncbi:hypothetical protein D6853_05495 [Butyrivibrio sp. X503]|uniref:AbrB/MazE/SpoVT family DNA-binding domain-containing protein n=1 Tax=Butyrivibrio sp. X503 TaxID=2364878 RepID=UPI000EA8A9E1|nr:hypothetical protein [Butyrivibrio sp. X503]RKM56248.1 hypothetical protein D6853_05495 [Butyrivibrio sp. X503]
MRAQVKTWGNSQGIRIPKEELQEAKAFRHRALEERVAEYGGKLNIDGELCESGYLCYSYSIW